MQFRLKPMGNDKNTRHHATLQATKMETHTVAWTRDYPHETPMIWPAEDDRLVLAWDLSDETAQSEIKNYPALQSEEQAMNTTSRGLLIETVNPHTGAPGQQVLIPEADLTHGWDDVRRAKPDPEIVRRSMEALALEPRNCVVIEDAVAGIQAARSAGAGADRILLPSW